MDEKLIYIELKERKKERKKEEKERGKKRTTESE